MLLEQAIFTSTVTGTSAGYQLLGVSPGISETEQMELAAWAPSHDSLSPGREDLGSINGRVLASGRICLSETRLSGGEYSGRGERVWTSLFVVPQVVWRRFTQQPLAIMRAIRAKGFLRERPQIPACLPPFSLAGRAAPVERAALTELLNRADPGGLQLLLDALAHSPRVLVCGAEPAEAWLNGILNLLPPELREGISFSTGLRYSTRRATRLTLVPALESRAEVLAREGDLTVLQCGPNGRIRLLAGPELAGDNEPRAWIRWIESIASRQSFEELSKLWSDWPEPWTWQNLDRAGEESLERDGAMGIPTTEIRNPLTAAQLLAQTQGRDAAPLPDDGTAPYPEEEELLTARIDAATPLEPCLADIPTVTATRHATTPEHAAAQLRVWQAAARASGPSRAVALANHELLDQLETLDDEVFAALNGDQPALRRFTERWPGIRMKIDSHWLLESRAQYLDYALKIWDQSLAGCDRDPALSIRAVEVIGLLFEPE